MIFVDGENLTFRYQEMIKGGKKPAKNVVHIPDIFVWHPEITTPSYLELRRVSYYTSMVADEPAIEDTKQKIGRISYEYYDVGIRGTYQICNFIFKKEKQKEKTRKVDINIIIDVMRCASFEHIDLIILVSGDGDYLPLINEVMHKGKQVWVYALSSGLDKRLIYTTDEFLELDKIMFE